MQRQSELVLRGELHLKDPPKSWSPAMAMLYLGSMLNFNQIVMLSAKMETN